MSVLHVVPDPEMSADQERLVMLALSRLLGEMEGWRSYTYNLCRIVAALEGLDLTRDQSGQLQEVPFRAGKLVMQSRAWTPEELKRLWVSARRQKRPYRSPRNAQRGRPEAEEPAQPMARRERGGR